jgi:hypothetical protein
MLSPKVNLSTKERQHSELRKQILQHEKDARYLEVTLKMIYLSNLNASK